MRKIDRLKLALKSGAFWQSFARKTPVISTEVNYTPKDADFIQKSNELWAKYTDLRRKYLDGQTWASPDSPYYARCIALYEAHDRDFTRLTERYPSW
jgi:hypothetical protein